MTALIAALSATACSLAPAASVAGPVALTIGQPAPALSGPTIEGGTLDLSSLRGEPVIVNFWASWCVPCRDEFGLFKSALTRHGAAGLRVVGVVFQDDASAARTFAQSVGATWPSVTDASGAIATRYRVIAPPQTYFIDRNGVVRDRQIGEIASDAEMETLLAGILQ